MSLSSLTVQRAPSGISFTGGTTESYSVKSSSGKTLNLMCTADTDYRTARTMSFTANPPNIAPLAPNGYTQARNSVTLKVPKLLANGKITVNTINVTISTDVETTSAEISFLMDTMSQVMSSANAVTFFHNQALV